MVLYAADDLSGQARTQIMSILQFVGGATVQQPEYVNELSSGCRQSLRVCTCACVKDSLEAKLCRRPCHELTATRKLC